MHLYQMSEWQSGSNRWYVNDIQELATDASKWWTPVRMLGVTPEEYVLMLKNKFKANNITYSADTNVLTFSFATQADARKFKNWMNAEARKRKYMCGQ